MRTVLFMQHEITLEKGSYVRRATFGLETGSAPGQSPLCFSPANCGRVAVPGSVKKMVWPFVIQLSGWAGWYLVKGWT